MNPLVEELVRSEVASGLYTSASEVVREALRLMDQQVMEQVGDDYLLHLDGIPAGVFSNSLDGCW